MLFLKDIRYMFEERERGSRVQATGYVTEEQRAEELQATGCVNYD